LFGLTCFTSWYELGWKNITGDILPASTQDGKLKTRPSRIGDERMVRGATPVRLAKEKMPVIPLNKKPAGAATGCESQPHSLWVRLLQCLSK